MVEIRWTKQAIEDVNEIAEYIGQDSEYYAVIQVERFYEKIKILNTTTKAGRVVPELEDDFVRELISGNYRIIYKILSGNKIDIVAVIHGMRLLKNHRKFKGE